MAFSSFRLDCKRWLKVLINTAMTCTLWVGVNLTSTISALARATLMASQRERGVIPSGIDVPSLAMTDGLSRFEGRTGVPVEEGTTVFLVATFAKVCLNTADEGAGGRGRPADALGAPGVTPLRGCYTPLST